MESQGWGPGEPGARGPGGWGPGDAAPASFSPGFKEALLASLGGPGRVLVLVGSADLQCPPVGGGGAVSRTLSCTLWAVPWVPLWGQPWALPRSPRATAEHGCSSRAAEAAWPQPLVCVPGRCRQPHGASVPLPEAPDAGHPRRPRAPAPLAWDAPSRACWPVCCCVVDRPGGGWAPGSRPPGLHARPAQGGRRVSLAGERSAAQAWSRLPVCGAGRQDPCARLDVGCAADP